MLPCIMIVTEAFCIHIAQSQMRKKETQNKQITEVLLATLGPFLSKTLAVRAFGIKILPKSCINSIWHFSGVQCSKFKEKLGFGLIRRYIVSNCWFFLQCPQHLQLYKACELMLALNGSGSYSSQVLFTAPGQINLSFFLEGSPIS